MEKRMAFHRKKEKVYVQYTLRIEENTLNKIRDISEFEKLSINEVVNQCLKFAIDDYENKSK